MLLRREHVHTVNGLMQPGRTAADKRNPAASTTRSWHIEFTPPNSALDQLGLLVQNRLRARMIPLPDLSRISFLSSRLPTISRVSSAEMPTRLRTSYRRHFFEPIEASVDIVAGMDSRPSAAACPMRTLHAPPGNRGQIFQFFRYARE